MCGTKYLVDVETKKVGEFNQAFIAYIKENYPNILESINTTGELTTKTEQLVREAVVEFKNDYGKEKEEVETVEEK